MKDHSGYTVWDYASIKGDIEAIQLLECHPGFEQVRVSFFALQMNDFL